MSEHQIASLIKSLKEIEEYDKQLVDRLIDQLKKYVKIKCGNDSKYLDRIEIINFNPPIWETHSKSNNKKYWLSGKEELLSLLHIIKGESQISEPVKPQVFIVHGRDDGMKQTVARTIERLDLLPIILHEQNDKGLTIIEKFELNTHYAKYAIILLSPDDEGKILGPDEEVKGRARQNVVFEFGYFVGKIGRENVFVLVKNPNEIEIPSDIHGLIYHTFDSQGKWRVELVSELIEAGFSVDPKSIINM